MEAIKKKENAAASMLPFGAGLHRDRRFSEVGFDPSVARPKPDRRHSDLTAYYYQHQFGLNAAPGSQLQVFPASRSANPQMALLSPPHTNPHRTSAVIPTSASAGTGPIRAEDIGPSPGGVPVAQVTGLERSDSNLNSSKTVQDWTTDDDEGTLENDEWCEFLDSQLEECLQHDLQVGSSSTSKICPNAH